MATRERDYYEVLGVPKDADDKAIKTAFRKLAQKYHPDRSTEPDAEERFKEIAEAYAVLSDPEKRRAYDSRGFESVRGYTEEDLFRDLDLSDLFGGVGLGGGPFGEMGGDLLERLFGVRRAAPRGADLDVELRLPLARVVTGGVETVRLRRPTVCSLCGGSGAKPGTSAKQCPECQGSGRKVTTRQSQGMMVQSVGTCPRCGGTGAIIEEPCPRCHGRGRALEEQAVSLRIPPGFEDGSVLLARGQGAPSEVAGGPPGDLRVHLVTAPDPRFERRGADLLRTETVSLTDAVLGTMKEVPTLEGAVRLKIPPGSQPGQILRLRGKGLPRAAGGARGDLLVTLRVQVPRGLSREERAHYEDLKRIEAQRPQGQA